MIFPADEKSIIKAAEIICAGGLVALPTETVYGLGADALNPVACAKIFEAKQRPFFDPLIVHIDTMEMLQDVAQNISPIAYILAEKFWPGPLTLVVPKSEKIPEIVTAGLTTVAVRMPAHPAARMLIKMSGRPIAAPSANPFGYLSPTCAAHVEKQIGPRIDMILDGGECLVGVESTIVRVDNDRVIILRPGGISRERLLEVVSDVEVFSGTVPLPDAPGLLPTHYAPHSRLVLVKEGTYRTGSESTGFLAFKTVPPKEKKYAHVECLSPDGNLAEAAANLFSALHRLDEKNLDVIYAEIVPPEGLGLAIMNRLEKAAAK